MTTFSPEAQELFDKYLQTVRWSVRGVADADEIERDVREHVTTALETQEEPVSSQTLRDVLNRLGDPWMWVAPEELPAWRRVLMRFWLGPEDWRLAYACFGMTMLGFLLLPIGIGLLFLVGAYFLARATHELAADRDGTLGPRRWLVNPPLAFFSGLLIIALLMGPAVPLIGWGIGEHGFERMMDEIRFSRVDEVQVALFMGSLSAMILGAWWLLLSAILAIAFRPFRWLVTPFADRMRRRHLLWLTGIAVVIIGAGIAVMATYGSAIFKLP